ncbi:MAG: hypothetical protein AAB480_00960 [Patescibacteria group bacterium]
MDEPVRFIIAFGPVFVLGVATWFVVSFIHFALSMLGVRCLMLATTFVTFVVFTIPVLRAMWWWRDSLHAEGDWPMLLGALTYIAGGALGFEFVHRLKRKRAR